MALALQGEEEILALMALAILIFSTAGLFPFMNFIAKRAFHFPGIGPPIPQETLIKDLLEINQWEAPVSVEQKEDRLIFTWKYLDAKWWEILAKTGIKKLYQLHVKLNPDKHEAIFIDIMKKVRWRAGPGQVKLSGGFFRGINLSAEFGKAWGIKENFKLGKIYDYQFKSSEIRNPVLNTLVKRGWSVRMGLW